MRSRRQTPRRGPVCRKPRCYPSRRTQRLAPWPAWSRQCSPLSEERAMCVLLSHFALVYSVHIGCSDFSYLHLKWAPGPSALGRCRISHCVRRSLGHRRRTHRTSAWEVDPLDG